MTTFWLFKFDFFYRLQITVPIDLELFEHKVDFEFQRLSQSSSHLNLANLIKCNRKMYIISQADPRLPSTICSPR